MTLSLLALACGPGSDGSGSGSADDTTSSTTTSSTTATTTSTSTTSDPTSDSFTTAVDTGTNTGPDGACDFWAQDCPDGEKCAPWASDGGSTWNAHKCVPVDPDPKGLDEPCTAPDGPTGGVDDCDHDLMCWDVDPDTLEGYCIGVCIGTNVIDPGCAEECSTCHIPADGVLALCFPQCDPVAQTCTQEGQGCYGLNQGFGCAPDASGDQGAYGDECQGVTDCDPGLLCLTGEFFPGCTGVACCSPACDVQNPVCPADPGVECLPWYEREQPETCFDVVIGVCGVPPP